MRIFAVCSYRGTNYQGWQKQIDTPTVQGTIEAELSKYFNREINIYAAGRTDTGVHALGQTFHFDIDEDVLDLDRLFYSLNSMLPPDIKIEDIDEVDPDFHARFSAKEKVYNYSIILDSKDVFFYDLMYLCPFNLDTKLLKEALTHFVGKHNFKNFTSKELDYDNFVREIYDIDTNIVDGFINITFRGNGFMRYMIRYLVGTAIEVARERLSLEALDELLDENSEREIVCYKAPACGLTLVQVIY